MMMTNITYILVNNSNFISFAQLKKAEILYYNNFKEIILLKTGNIIGSVQ